MRVKAIAGCQNEHTVWIWRGYGEDMLRRRCDSLVGQSLIQGIVNLNRFIFRRVLAGSPVYL